MGFDPEKHHADQDAVLADLRDRFKLFPELPALGPIHMIGIDVAADSPDEPAAVLCVHDAANECKHHVYYPASAVDKANPEEQGRIVGHVGRIIAASYN